MLKNFTKIFFVFVILAGGFLFAKSASAATYYIDPDITDTNVSSATPDCTTYDPVAFSCTGGTNSAYKTIADVNSKTFSAGDSILLKKGSTFSGTTLQPKGSGNSSQSITWSYYGSGSNPKIQNSSIRGIRMDGLSYIIIDGIDVSASGSDAFFFYTSGSTNVSSTTVRNLSIDTSGTGFNFFAGIPNAVTISNVTANGAASGIIGIMSNLTVENSSFNNGTTGISISTNSANATSTNIILTNVTTNENSNNGIATGRVNGLTISNSTISGNLRQGLYFGGWNPDDTNNVVISSSTISNNGSAGAYDGITIQGAVGNISIEDSLIFDNNNHGIAFGSGTNLNLSNSTSTSNAYNGINIGGGTVTISHSYFNSNASNGVTASAGTVTISDTTAQENLNDGFSWNGTVYMVCDHCSAISNGVNGLGSDGDGFTSHNSSSGVIRYSYAANNKKTDVCLTGTGSFSIYDNIFYHDTVGTLALVYLQGTTHTFYNNDVVSKGNTGTGVQVITGTSATLKNNIIYGFTTGIVADSGSTATSDYDLLYQNGSAQYTGISAGIHSLSQNPVFADLSSNDFRLQDSSPAINAGTDVALTSDYVGTAVPQGSTPDIGAYEYLLPSAAPTIDTPSALSSSSIRWNFTDGANNETGFRIYDNTNTLATSSATSNLTYLDETGLSENTQYSGRYAVAYNSAGESSHSSASTAIYTLADTPTNLSASSNSNSVTLSVDSFPNDTNGQSGYYFSRSGANSGWIQTSSWTDTGLSCGNEYTYSVKYRNGDGTETSEISTTKSTSGCGGGGSPAIWTLPTVPTGGFKMSINSGALTASNRIVTLGFNAGADIKKIAISMTGDFTDASQEDYSASKQWDLCSKLGGAVKIQPCPDGVYKVYAQFYTIYGRSSSAAIVSGTITLKSATATSQNSSPAVTFTKNLNLGSKDSQVRILQQFLNQNGYKLANSGFGSPGNETDFFGSLTSVTLSKFQEANKDKATGLINEKGFLGPITRQFINSFKNTGSTTTPIKPRQGSISAIFTAPLWKGLQSNDVRRLQTLLATKPEIYPQGLTTGYFGPLTEKAVQTFQLNYGVVVSSSDPGFGYVGPLTRAKLQEVFGNK